MGALKRWIFPPLDVQLKVTHDILDVISTTSNSGQKEVASELAKVASAYLLEYSKLLSNNEKKGNANTESA